jgi:hypothetical protein
MLAVVSPYFRFSQFSQCFLSLNRLSCLNRLSRKTTGVFSVGFLPAGAARPADRALAGAKRWDLRYPRKGFSAACGLPGFDGLKSRRVSAVVLAFTEELRPEGRFPFQNGGALRVTTIYLSHQV